MLLIPQTAAATRMVLCALGYPLFSPCYFRLVLCPTLFRSGGVLLVFSQLFLFKCFDSSPAGGGHGIFFSSSFFHFFFFFFSSDLSSLFSFCSLFPLVSLFHRMRMSCLSYLVSGCCCCSHINSQFNAVRGRRTGSNNSGVEEIPQVKTEAKTKNKHTHWYHDMTLH